MINFVLNGKKAAAEEGMTILQAARQNKVDIPNLCYLEGCKNLNLCRICVVEVAGTADPVTSCSTEVTEGMDIKTNSYKVIKARKMVLDKIAETHIPDCLTCGKSGVCKLQEYYVTYGSKDINAKTGEKRYEIDESNQFYFEDRNKCIKCGKCVQVCTQLQCSNAISFSDKGIELEDACTMEQKSDKCKCVSCGNCVSVCPVGALMPKSKEKLSAWNTKRTKTVCSYCGVGCEMYLISKGDRIVDVEPANGPANNGLLCVKGKFAYGFINHKDRLKKPLIKKEGKFVGITWEEAYDTIINKIGNIKENHGAEAFAGLASARVTNEENYLFQKMFRAAIGTNNVDHCARLCHASTVAGLAITLGSGAMTNSIEEAVNSDVIFITGTNTTENHPVIGARIKQAKARGAKIIVAEPRRIELADLAEVFLQIKPGTNVALLNGMMNVITEEGLQDVEYIQSRTEGYEDLVQTVKNYTPDKVAEICGIDAEDLRKAARLYAKGEKAAIYYSMGVTQHSTGTQGVMSVSNLALLCGNLGKESAGVNPLRGQNNVQGACDMGCLPGDLTGYQKVFNPQALEKFEKSWEMKLSDKAGLTVTEMLSKAEKGEIKFMYIMGENPMISDPDINHVKKALGALDFLVVQDIFLTETAELADLVLPAASFAEKDGTFTNTERRVQRVRKAVEAPGEAKADWVIIMEMMNRLGYIKKYNHPSEIMDEIAELTPSYGGISYERIEEEGLQWPCTSKDHPGTKILHRETFTRGKGLFKPAEYIESAELPDSEYPLILTTGRILYQYHTRTMTGKVDGLTVISGESYAEINPETASKLGITEGERVKVSSRRGEVITKARITDTIEEDVIFMPFHYADGAANYLTNNAVDPIAKIPEYKVCAVKLEKAV